MMGGAVNVASPEFDAEIMRGEGPTDELNPSVIRLTSAVATGRRIVVVITWISNTQTLTGVRDDAGNTYSLDSVFVHDTNERTAIVSAPVTTALTTSDDLLFDWNETAFANHSYAVFTLVGTSAIDVSKTANGYGTSPSGANNTVADKTTCIGLVDYRSTTTTYGSSAWTSVGSMHSLALNKRVYYVRKTLTTNGSQNPAGTLSGSESWGINWVAYK